MYNPFRPGHVHSNMPYSGNGTLFSHRFLRRIRNMAALRSSPTPNPNSLKFTLDDGTFIESGMESFNRADEAVDHDLGRRLFEISGITNVFIMPDFLTVTKEQGARWKDIESAVEDAVGEYLADG